MISPIGITQAVSYNVVVSADIIEYGTSILDKDFSNNNSSSINTKKLGELELYEGQNVKYKNFDNTTIETIVIGYDTSKKSYQLKYLDNDNTYQIKNVLEGSYRRIILN